MGTVQIRLFHRTVPVFNPRDSEAVLDELQAEVNDFISPILPMNVLAVRTSVNAVGKYGELNQFLIQVTYLQE